MRNVLKLMEILDLRIVAIVSLLKGTVVKPKFRLIAIQF